MRQSHWSMHGCMHPTMHSIACIRSVLQASGDKLCIKRFQLAIKGGQGIMINSHNTLVPEYSLVTRRH